MNTTTNGRRHSSKLQKTVRDSRVKQIEQAQINKKRELRLAENFSRNRLISELFWNLYSVPLPEKYKASDIVRKNSNSLNDAFEGYHRLLRQNNIDDSRWKEITSSFEVYDCFSSAMMKTFDMEEKITLEEALATPPQELISNYHEVLVESFTEHSFAVQMWKHLAKKL